MEGSSMTFLREPEVIRGKKLAVIDGISRIVAGNPGPMTYHGTNTYLIEGADGFTVLDPGPDEILHLEAILEATEGRVARILLSHTHHDHVGALPALRARTGAPVYAYHRSADPDFTPDIGLHDGETIDGWTALYTPGHAADHLCFARADGVVFTADHVMSWSTTVVSPPRGDMAAYFDSLHRLLARDDRLYLPGHGPKLPTPRGYVEGLLTHRRQREAAILAALQGQPRTSEAIAAELYSAVHPRLRAAAERNVVAHLQKLRNEGRVRQNESLWQAA
jgi:glyoxylase-like metal-dependent hydrolase (beta-lactamase superfamily II)